MADRTSVNLAPIRERLDNLRSDLAWKALSMSKKVSIVLDVGLEKLEKEKESEKSDASPSTSADKAANFIQKLASGSRPTNCEVIDLARDLDIQEESLLSVRDRLFPSQKEPSKNGN